ncbi:MAG: hypothetical protein R2708_25090 [Vicinamibacterales bacterium]
MTVPRFLYARLALGATFRRGGRSVRFVGAAGSWKTFANFTA